MATSPPWIRLLATIAASREVSKAPRSAASIGRHPREHGWHRRHRNRSEPGDVASPSMSVPTPTIAPAEGRLGVLTVGLGAVSSTLIAGVELAKRGMAAPIGSLTQLGTMRLGKRTEGRSPLIRDV